MPKTPIRHKERLFPGGALPWAYSGCGQPDARGLWGSHVCRAGLCAFVRGRTPVQWGCRSLCVPVPLRLRVRRVPATLAVPRPLPPRRRPAPARPRPLPPPGPCPAPPLRRRDPGPCPARLTSGRCCSAVRSSPALSRPGGGRLLRPPGPSRRAGSTAPPAARGERGGRGHRSRTAAASSRTPSLSPTPLQGRNLGGDLNPPLPESLLGCSRHRGGGDRVPATGCSCNGMQYGLGAVLTGTGYGVHSSGVQHGRGAAGEAILMDRHGCGLRYRRGAVAAGGRAGGVGSPSADAGGIM